VAFNTGATPLCHMSFFDRLRPKWKNADPLVREAAVRELNNESLLEKIAMEDPAERVRIAAVETIEDQYTLAQFARADTALAPIAMKRLTERAVLCDVAISSESRAVREMAIDRIDDPVVLHRIATSDTDARLRAKARIKRLGPDETRDYIRSELSKLKLAQRKAEQMAEFCGSLNDVCSALIGDGRFAINGGLAAEESTAEKDESAEREACAQFLAFKREAAEKQDAATSNIFYEIKVWRTDRDTFECTAEEKRLAIVQDAVVWSRVSNGATGSAVSDPKLAVR
jgi:hypothetical protein